MELPSAAEILPTVTLQKRQETESENAYIILIIDTFEHYLWKAIAPEARNKGTPNLELEV